MGFPERLRELREKKELTQTELGKIFNLSKQTISSYEKGGSRPSQETLIKMAEFFDVPIGYLLGTESGIAREAHVQYSTNHAPDTNSVFQAKTLADAIIRIEKMRREFNLSKEWMYDMWDKAIEVYGQPEGRGGVAAHGPSYPGSGALDGGDEPR